MLTRLKNKIPRRRRVLVFLTVTSVIGVMLVFIAMTNASRDLEAIAQVNNLHRAVSLLDGHQSVVVTSAGHPVHSVLLNDTSSKTVIQKITGLESLDSELLEHSRINVFGGVLATHNTPVSWVLGRQIDQQGQRVYLQTYDPLPLGTLLEVYAKRLIIPAVFYVWLMVWVALIIQHLISRLQMQKNKMQHLAYHDALSGLPNRNGLMNRLNELVWGTRSGEEKFAVALIDLDRFKPINDQYGHAVGDELLRHVAARFKLHLRDTDMVARFGGDEFMAVMVGVDPAHCSELCGRVLESLLAPYAVQGHQLTIGLSIGVAFYPEHGKDPDQLIQRADEAMYSIKAQGGGIRFVDDEHGFTETTVGAM